MIGRVGQDTTIGPTISLQNLLLGVDGRIRFFYSLGLDPFNLILNPQPGVDIQNGLRSLVQLNYYI